MKLTAAQIRTVHEALGLAIRDCALSGVPEAKAQQKRFEKLAKQLRDIGQTKAKRKTRK